MTLTDTLENYLASIYENQINNGYARVKDISNVLSIKHTSVIEALKKLQEAGFVIYEKRGFIRLTQKGINKSKKIFQRRMLIKRFFNDLVDIDVETSNEIATRVEHVTSDLLLNRMEQFIDFFQENPEIKGKLDNYLKEGCKNTENLLVNYEIGDKVKVYKIKNDNEFVAARLSVLGINPGVEIELKGKAPLGDPVEIEINGTDILLRRNEAASIIVEKEE